MLAGLAAPALAQTAPSSVKIGTAPLVDPTAANTWYTTNTVSTNSLGTTGRPPEIVELARALSNDPDKIYDYVRNNVEIVWTYGLQKGALGAITDKSGTAFDQAHLMVELLRQANYTASYKVGTITLTGAQFEAWSGITDAKAACQMLASGGIPAVINTTTQADCNYTGSITTIKVAHIWVSVTIGGTAYLFDPAYKGHVFKTGVANLNTTAAVTPGDTLADAAPVGAGTESTVSYIENVNAEAIEANLTTSAGAVQTYIDTNVPAGEVEDIVGGQKITRYDAPPTGLRQTVLPYTATLQKTWTGNIPNKYRTALTVQITKYRPDTTYLQIINKTLYVDEIATRKLIFDTNFDTDFNLDNVTTFTGALKVVGEVDYVVTAASYTNGDSPIFSSGVITLTVNPPYAAPASGTTLDGTYMNGVVSKRVTYMAPLTIVHSWGDVSPEMVGKWGSRADKPMPPSPSPTDASYAADVLAPMMGDPGQVEIPGTVNSTTNAMCENCLGGASSTMGDGRREQMAVSWMVQSSEAADLHAAIAKSVYAHHWSLGVVSADTQIRIGDAMTPGGTRRHYFIVDSFDRVDVDTAFSLTPKGVIGTETATDVAKRRRGAVFAIAATLETLEGSIAGQIGDLPDVNSTSTRFAWGNRPPAAEDQATGDPPRRFYSFTSANADQVVNVARVENLLTTTADGVHDGGEPEIGANEMARRKAALATAIDLYTDNGFVVTASGEAFLGPGQRGGAYYVPDPQDPYEFSHRDSKQRGGAFVAIKYSGEDPIEIAHVIVGPDGISKGGGGGAQMFQQAQYDPATAADVLKARFQDRSSAMGVDVGSGSLSFTSPASLTVGAGSFPYSLNATLTWTGGDWESPVTGPENPVPPQSPWSTNWNNSLSMSGSGMEAMGVTDVRASAGTIASFVTMQDVYRATSSTERDVTASLISAWWGRQLVGNTVTVSLGADSRQFVKRYDGQWFAPGAGGYATLTQTGNRLPIAELPPCNDGIITFVGTRGWDYSGMGFTVTKANGDVQTFSYWKTIYSDGMSSCSKHNGFRLTSWTFPQGVNLTVAYSSPPGELDKLASVSNNLGRTIEFLDSGQGGFTNGLSGDDYRAVTVTPDSTTFAYVGIGTQDYVHTDADGKPHKFTTELVGDPALEPRGARWRLTKVYTPDNLTVAAVQYDYDSLGRVKEVRDANALQLGDRGPYQFLIAKGARGERIDPAGGRYAVLYDQDGRAFRYIDEIGRTTNATYDGRGRTTGYAYPELDQELLGYDDRNNITLVTRKAKPGSGLADITTSASWNPTWNKLASITDPLGATTTFTYGSTGGSTGQMTLAVRSDPDGGGAKLAPEYKFTYTAKGQVATTEDPTGLIVSNTYDAQGNLLTSALDPSGINAITAYTYDAQGDTLTVDGPRTDVTDISYARYDKLRRKTYEIGPDQDGAGALQRPVTRTTYDVEGQVTQVDRGKAQQTDASDFAVLQTMTTVYDPVGNKIRINNQAAVTQIKYDAANRPLCQVLRMNPAVYGSLPSDACTLGTQGANGPDRITKTTYDLAGQTLTTMRGVGSPEEQTYATYTYSPNGQQLTITDARGNRSTMQYDGFDRLCRLSFPVASVGANQSSPVSAALCRTTATLTNPDTATTGDFEETRYDAAGRKTWTRRRDGQVIHFEYDTLGRETKKDLPGTTTLDVFSDYDAAGRITSLRHGGTSGAGIVLGFDSAKRMTSEETFGKAMTYEYDLAGNRTRVTWFDGPYAQYSYNAAGQLTMIGENGATSGAGVLATFTYDDLGRRTSLSRGANLATTTYSYDSANRLTALNQNPSGTSFDQSWTYSWNPASQVLTRGSTNTAYKWATPTPGTESKAFDGLNRDAAVVTAGGYDLRGNLTADGGGRTFVYDVENRLITVGGTVDMTLSYDPIGRLAQTVSGGTTNNFLYDSDRLSAEYNTSGIIVRRYVHGPGVDEPLVWYEGSTLGDPRWLHHDAQGSVVAYSTGTGTINAANVYKYGPWGEPDDNWAAGASRFRYTGQIALPEVRLYHYKARVYDPAAGRFLQTDPIGYEDDLDLYAYVGGDPLNNRDPDGLAPLESTLPPGLPKDYKSPQWKIGQWTAKNPVEALGNIIFGVSVAVDLFDTPASPGPDVSLGGLGVRQALKPKPTPKPKPGAKGSDEGCIYCVSGDKTPSGKDYVGSADDLAARAKSGRDGRDRNGAEVVGRYPKGDRAARQEAEQNAINERGGVGNLDNKRNEIAPKDWEKRGIRPPQ